MTRGKTSRAPGTTSFRWSSKPFNSLAAAMDQIKVRHKRKPSRDLVKSDDRNRFRSSRMTCRSKKGRFAPPQRTQRTQRAERTKSELRQSAAPFFSVSSVISVAEQIAYATAFGIFGS